MQVEPLELRRQARETTEILSDPQFTTPTPVVEGLWENPVQYAEQIGESLAPFQATLDEIDELALEPRRNGREVGRRWRVGVVGALGGLGNAGFCSLSLPLL